MAQQREQLKTRPRCACLECGVWLDGIGKRSTCDLGHVQCAFCVERHAGRCGACNPTPPRSDAEIVDYLVGRYRDGYVAPAKKLPRAEAIEWLRKDWTAHQAGFAGPHSPRIDGKGAELWFWDITQKWDVPPRFRIKYAELARLVVDSWTSGAMRRAAHGGTEPLARSTANKAKAAKKKAARQAPRPKAQITARAKLVNVASAAGKEKGTGQYGNDRPVNAVRLTIDVNMGAPATAPAWPAYKSANGWGRRSFIERELHKLKPAKPKVPKAKKGKAAPDAPEEPTTILQAFDEAAETKRLGAEYDAELRTKWERECEKANNANARFMQRAAAFAMFLALRGQDVQLTLSPIQQGFVEMFAGQAQPAELPMGGDDDAGDDDMDGDKYDDEDGDDE